MEESDYKLNQFPFMKKSSLFFLGALITLGLFSLVGFILWRKEPPMSPVQTPLPPSTSNIKSSSDITTTWKTYRNEEYGFEVKYPNRWTSIKDLRPYNSDDLFNFSTENGYKATFGIDKFSPPEESQRLDQYKKTHQSGNPSLQVNDILIGDESGFETGGILCEVEQSCAARFEFLSKALIEKGFKFFLVVSDLHPRQSDPTVTPSGNPYLLFNEEVQMVRKVLSSFKWTE